MTVEPDRILRMAAMLERTGLSRSTLYRKIDDGAFPRQVKLSARSGGWRESEIAEWMRNPMYCVVEERKTG